MNNPSRRPSIRPVRTLLKPVLLGIVATFCLAQSIPGSTRTTKPEEWRLLNGLRILVWRTEEPVVTVKLRIHSGSIFDPRGKEGTMAILSRALFPNDGLRDFFREDLGGDFAISHGYDFIQIDASGRSDRLLEILEVLSTGVTAPDISKDSIARLKTLQTGLAESATLRGRTSVSDNLAAEALVGRYPLGRPVSGTVSSVQAIDFVDILQAKNKFVHAGNATLAISGKVDLQSLNKISRRLFGGWTKADSSVPATFAQPGPVGTAVVRGTSGAISDGTSDIRMAFRTVSAGAANAPAMSVVVEVLRTRTMGTGGARGTFDLRSRSLPSLVVIGIEGAVNESQLEELSKIFSSEITESEFAAAVATLAADAERTETGRLMERRLDLHTFGLPATYDEAATLRKLALDEVRTSHTALRAAGGLKLIVSGAQTVK